MTSSPPSKDTPMRNHTVRRPLAAAGALAATLTLAACGSSGGSTGAPAPSAWWVVGLPPLQITRLDREAASRPGR